MAEQSFAIGYKFKFNNNPTIYQINEINSSFSYCICNQLNEEKETNKNLPLMVYLNMNQLNYTIPIEENIVCKYMY